MKLNSASKISYPKPTKARNQPELNSPFLDDNLRDPLQIERSPLLDSHGLRFNSDGFSPRNKDASPADPKNPHSIGMSKSHTALFGHKKQQKLQPLERRAEGSAGISKGVDAAIDAQYAVSDFYLKNFLGKQKNELDLRKTKDNFGGSPPLINSADKGTFYGTTGSFRMSNSDLRKTKSPPGKFMPAELIQLASTRDGKQRFYESLPVSYKEFFMDKKDFMRMFDDIDIGMYCLDEVVERLKCYRFELGSLLDKVGASFKMILSKMLDLTMKISGEKDLIHERKMEENFQGIKLLENEKKALEEKNKQYKNLSDVTESEANIYKFNVKSLQNEVSMLYELLKKDYLVQERQERLMDEDEENKQTLAEAGRPANEIIAEPSKQLAKNLLTLQESIKNLESEQHNKESKLQEMNNLLKAMLRGGKKEASTQVDEGELAWAAKNILSNDDYKPRAQDFENYETATVNLDQHLVDQLNKGEAIAEGVDPVQVLKFKEKAEKKELEDQLAQAKQGHSRGAGLPVAVGDNWSLPLTLIVFLENITKANKTANVLPWPFFKRIIYEVYQDRIVSSGEIQSSLINSGVTLGEYLPIYFLKNYRLRRTAEMKMLEFTVSLKYYIRTWQRAATFANLCNISNIRLEPSGSSNAALPESDIYTQNFFLYAFNKATSNYASIYDNADGTSYILKERVDELTNEILAFEIEANRKKFLGNIARMFTKFVDGGKELEGIDVDKLLNAFLETYLEVKTRNVMVLTKHFYKHQSSGEGVLSLDEVTQMTADVIEIESPLPGLAYPKELSVCRAFLYALTSGKNALSVTYKDFINGMARFGIDCPFPFVNVSGPGIAGSVNMATSLLFGDKNMQKPGVGIKPKMSVVPGMKNAPNIKALADMNKKIDDETSSTGSIKMTGHGQDKDKKKKEEDKGMAFKIDATSTLFAQHFGIIRELKSYCTQFKEMMGKEEDVQKVWKSFEQIVQALDAGCQFLSYPVTM